MPDRKALLVPALFAVQAAMVHWAASGEVRPQAPGLDKFPSAIPGWSRTGVNPTDIPEQVLHAGRLADWDYRQTTGSATANLFIAWFPSLRSGLVQPHSPQICLPGNGWTMEKVARISIATSAGAVPASRIDVAKGSQRGLVLYWYQMPRRPVAGEWESKLWLTVDLFHEKRTDLALVRVVVMEQKDEGERMRLATEFTRAAYPAVREWLPH